MNNAYQEVQCNDRIFALDLILYLKLAWHDVDRNNSDRPMNKYTFWAQVQVDSFL